MPKRHWSYVEDPVALGQRLREAREKAGLSQRQLAFPGCSAVYISRIERGERVPSLQLLRELALQLNVQLGYLERGEVEGPRPEDEHQALVREASAAAQAEDIPEFYEALAAASAPVDDFLRGINRRHAEEELRREQEEGMADWTSDPEAKQRAIDEIVEAELARQFGPPTSIEDGPRWYLTQAFRLAGLPRALALEKTETIIADLFPPSA